MKCKTLIWVLLVLFSVAGTAMGADTVQAIDARIPFTIMNIAKLKH